MHDYHRHIDVGFCYEEEKGESMRHRNDRVKFRLPKQPEYWEKVLKSNKVCQDPWLLGSSFAYADLVLWQVSPSGFQFRFDIYDSYLTSFHIYPHTRWSSQPLTGRKLGVVRRWYPVCLFPKQ